MLACRELIWDSAAELLKRGVDVILDDRFFLRENRMRCIALSRRAGAGATIHFIDTPLSVIRARLDQRNARLPQYNFWIGPDSLETFAERFEIPSNDEGADLIVVRDIGILLREAR